MFIIRRILLQSTMEKEQEKKRPNEEKQEWSHKKPKKSEEWTKYEEMTNKLFEDYYKVLKKFLIF